MDATQIGLFDLADKRLAYLDQRQTMLAQNIANLDTPGFAAQDLTPFAATLSAMSAAGSPVMTSPLHMEGTSGGPRASHARPKEKAVDGNAVSLTDQLTKIASDDNAHELVTDLYKKYLGLFRTALGRSS